MNATDEKPEDWGYPIKMADEASLLKLGFIHSPTRTYLMMESPSVANPRLALYWVISTGRLIVQEINAPTRAITLANGPAPLHFVRKACALFGMIKDDL